MSREGRPFCLWLRAETKPGERRAALVPEDAARLVADGVELAVERSAWRAFPDAEYERAGCRLVGAGSWEAAPERAVVLGLKELPESRAPLRHRHVYFAHAFKGQQGWEELLGRFVRGGGTLLDLEYLADDAGRRVAAFGRWAGFGGAAVGLDLWAHQQLSCEPYPRLDSFPSREALLSGLRPRLAEDSPKAGNAPPVLVLGAKGRCGGGALDALREAGVSAGVLAWDVEETAAGGPFEETLRHDILLNCVLLSGPTKPFLTREMLGRPRRLSVVSDVSCDPYSPHNPLPVYDKTTTFERPSLRLKEGAPPLDLTAIDHLPSLLPRESSADYSAMLRPHLSALRSGSPVWDRAAALFDEKTRPLRVGGPT